MVSAYQAERLSQHASQAIPSFVPNMTVTRISPRHSHTLLERAASLERVPSLCKPLAPHMASHARLLSSGGTQHFTCMCSSACSAAPREPLEALPPRLAGWHPTHYWRVSCIIRPIGNVPSCLGQPGPASRASHYTSSLTATCHRSSASAAASGA